MSQTKAQLIQPIGVVTASGVVVSGVMTAATFDGGKDQLVKGINTKGKERYFALSSVDSFTDYYKRLDQ